MRRLQRNLVRAAAALALAFLSGPTAAQSLVRRPYLQMLTPTDVTIVWRTDVATDSRVRLGSSPQSLPQTVDLTPSVVDHAVRITGLAAGTRYYYSVGTTAVALEGGDDTHYFETAPLPGTRKKLRAWVVGDAGVNAPVSWDMRDAALTYMGSDRPHLFLTAGDMANVYGLDEEFTTNFFGVYPAVLRNTVTWPTYGNHEGWYGNSQTQTGAYYDAYVLPTAAEAGGAPSGTEAYYSFDYANIHFVVLNTYDVSLDPSGAMLTWLGVDLAQNQQEWLIAYFHHPPYSKGPHDSDEDPQEILIRENVVPILEDAGVDLVFSGHSHDYERSHLVDGAYDTPTTAAGHVLDPGDGAPLGDGPYIKPAGLTPHAGTVYVVTGHGAWTGSVGLHPLMHVADSHTGSTILDVQGNRLAMLDIRSDGIVGDRFSIIKGEGLVIGAPDGGETIQQGSTYVIRWATAGSIPAVSLSCSLDAGASWTPIAQGITNTGWHSWTPPDAQSTRALVKVSHASDAEVFDESNMSFTLAGSGGDIDAGVPGDDGGASDNDGGTSDDDGGTPDEDGGTSGDDGGTSGDDGGTNDGGGGGEAGEPCLDDTPVCVTFRRGSLGAVEDATLWQGAPGWNDGASTKLYTGTSSAGYRVSIVGFDLSSIPEGSAVCSATLRLVQGWKSTSSTVEVHEALMPWDELGVTWASYNQAWDPLVLGSFTASGPGGERAVDVTAVVEGWVDGIPSDGFVIEEAPVDRSPFYSSDYGTLTRRPALDVCYVP